MSDFLQFSMVAIVGFVFGWITLDGLPWVWRKINKSEGERK